MNRRRFRFAVVVVAVAACVLVAWACGSSGDSTFPPIGSSGGPADDGSTTLFGGDAGDAGAPDACTGIACMRVACADGGTTSLSGTVVSPRQGDPDPVYNAIVYVPNATVAAFTPGVTCDRCGVAVSGDPIAVALTGIDGRFTLTDIPVVDNLPVVVQLGRWRRQITIPTVAACADTPLTKDQTRLPRNHAEGDIPLMALKTGDSDSPECVLRKMGIDDAEFTAPGAGGRIEVYRGALANPPTLDAGTPPVAALLDDAGTMNRYDIVLLPCDGSDFTADTASLKDLEAYANAGGRVFASHYSYNWIKQQPPPSLWSGVATWDPAAQIPNSGDSVPGVINTTFPKGLAMAQWLDQLAAADGGVIPVLWQPREDVDAVNGDGGVLEWIAEDTLSRVGHFSFDTPLGVDAGAECGRVVFNDFHTVNVFGGQTGIFPAECGDRSAPLTSQERVFEFMLFDLSSCVQTDSLPPVAPPGTNVH